MMAQLSDANTLLDKDNDLWVGVLCANGDNFSGRPGYAEVLWTDSNKQATT